MSELPAREITLGSDTEPRILSDEEIRVAQQKAIVLLAQHLKGTPILQVFTIEDFTGERLHSTGMGRNYRAVRTANDFGDEISVQAMIKASDHSKGDFLGDEWRIKRPSSIGTSREFEHFRIERDGNSRKGDANTDLNVEGGLEAIKQLPKIK